MFPSAHIFAVRRSHPQYQDGRMIGLSNVEVERMRCRNFHHNMLHIDVVIGSLRSLHPNLCADLVRTDHTLLVGSGDAFTWL